MNRDRFLIAHGVDASRWIARYGMRPFTHACDGCGELLTTSIPFSYGTFRGLIAPRCACGNEYPPYCIMRDPRYGDLFSGDEAVVAKARGLRRTRGEARLIRLPAHTRER